MQCNENRAKTLSKGQVAWLLGTDSKTVDNWAEWGIIKTCRRNCRGDRQFERADIGDLLARLGA